MADKDSGTEPTREGVRKIERWSDAKVAVERAKRELTRSEVELSNATRDLGNWLVPNDAKEGEQFCVWYGASLIAATAKADGDFTVSVRTRGKGGQRL